MSDNMLCRIIEHLLDDVENYKAEVTFYREAGNDRQRVLDRHAIDQRAEGGPKPTPQFAAFKSFNGVCGSDAIPGAIPMKPADIVSALKSFQNEDKFPGDKE
jgi:hypothetical protein